MHDTIRIMVDIETLDTIESAHILSIGAVAYKGSTELDFFYENPHSNQVNRTISFDTAEFWRNQFKENFPVPGNKPLRQVLGEFNEWCQNLVVTHDIQLKNIEFWCSGTDFDFVILRSAYKSFNLNIPWNYSMVRDFRTIKKLFLNIPAPTENANLHDALCDAKHQMLHLLEILKCITPSSQTN